MNGSPARDIGEVIGQLIGGALVIGLVVWFILALARRPSKGSAQGRWAQAVQICSADPRFRLGQVTSAQEYPQRGTAGWVTWYGTGQQQSVWFEQVYPRPGGWVVVTGGPRPAAPGTDPNTFYVDRVHDVIY
ncbi:hypothetical protein FHR72_002494 [Mycolicibacterium iranicum]|uniref:Uncharacterized protein n=1 Tax=Mycolicibacterium iranicum TaxID=912594 RepID=A0A839QF16_MYCIR|nr:hypothetical protein [Mycolicibacterium iranicum]MBB2991021.1 hypothetical protein [Mycolicibacterium iranicum]